MTFGRLTALTVATLPFLAAACASSASSAHVIAPQHPNSSPQFVGLRDQCTGIAGAFLVDHKPAAAHETHFGCRYVGLDGRSTVNLIGYEDGNYAYMDAMPDSSAVPTLRALNQAASACVTASGTFAPVGDPSNSTYACTVPSRDPDLLVIAPNASWSWQTPLAPAASHP